MHLADRNVPSSTNPNSSSSNLLNRVDWLLLFVVLHSNQQTTRVQNSVVVRPIQGFDPCVPAIVGHVYIWPYHGDGFADTPLGRNRKIKGFLFAV